MSQVQPIAQVQAGALPLLQALVAGRIVSRRRIATQDGAKFLTILKLAAPDEFSSPQTIEVKSSEQLGEVGDVARCKVRIGGYGRTYDRKDEDTGEVRKVQTANITLEVVA